MYNSHCGVGRFYFVKSLTYNKKRVIQIKLPPILNPGPYKTNSYHFNQSQLQSLWLNLARVLWISIVVPTYALFIVNIPAYFMSLQLLHTLYEQSFTGQLTLADVHTLKMWNLSLDFYATCMVVVSLLFQ